MENSQLGRLPAELRIYIFELSLSCDETINIPIQHPSGEKPSTLKDNPRFPEAFQAACSISYTCHQARHETDLSKFYSLNSFIAAAGPEDPMMESALDFEESIENAATTIAALTRFFESRGITHVGSMNIEYGISFQFLDSVYGENSVDSANRLFDQIHAAGLGSYGPVLKGAVFNVQFPYGWDLDSHEIFVPIDTARMRESCREAQQKLIDDGTLALGPPPLEDISQILREWEHWASRVKS